jgi:hypothetical protein
MEEPAMRNMLLHRTFIIGDVHGQLDLLKKLVRGIETKCGKSGYEIVLAGDVMDRGPKSYEAYRYIADHRNISSVLGNHDDFYTGGKLKLMDAFHAGNGGYETFEDMLSYYSSPGNVFPELSSKPGLKLSTDVRFLYFIIKDLFPKYPKLLERIKTEYGDGIIPFLIQVFGEMRENLKKHPYIRIFKKNGNMFALTHSGHIPTNKHGKIISNEELKKNAGRGKSNIKHQAEKTLWSRDEIVSRVCNHIILHGHTPALTGRKGHGPNYCVKSGELVSVNLDGGAALMNNINFSEEVRDAARLLCLELDSGILTSIDRHGRMAPEVKIEFI